MMKIGASVVFQDKVDAYISGSIEIAVIKRAMNGRKPEYWHRYPGCQHKVRVETIIGNKVKVTRMA